MNEDNYKIVLSLSHRRISFEYWLRDSEDKLMTFPKGHWPAPLAFYCSRTGIIIGEDADKAALLGTANAFDNYFERLNKNETYVLGGQEKPIANLLLDAAETEFREFYSDILFNRYGSLNENRANMPLIIVCEVDLESKERAYITDLFKRSGYARMKVVDYDSYIEKYVKQVLSKDYSYDKFLVAWTEGVDLVLTLFDINSAAVKQQVLLKDMGIDPRLSYVKNLIWKDVVGANQFLNRSTEEAAITKAASDFLNSSAPMVNEHLLLSDKQNYFYSLNRVEIEFLHNQNETSIKLREKLESFLLNTGVNDREQVLLILRGVAAGNNYFEQNLSCGFARTLRSDIQLRNRVMNLIIKEPSTPKPSTPKPSSPKPSTPDLKKINREWHKVRAVINGKIRTNKLTEALSICQDYLLNISSISGIEDLVEEVKGYIKELDDALKKANIEKPDFVKPLKKTKKVEIVDKGLNLIADGKIKEARDWYREKGNQQKTRILSDIIRSQKGIDIRKREIEGYRENKNKEQIGRIVKEIEDFIDLCDKVGLPIADYKKLLSEYKNIK